MKSVHICPSVDGRGPLALVQFVDDADADAALRSGSVSMDGKKVMIRPSYRSKR